MMKFDFIWYYITGNNDYYSEIDPAENATLRTKMIEFAKSNEETPMADFVKRIETEMPEIEYYHKIKMMKTMRSIRSILIFFFVVALISIIAGVIYAVMSSGAHIVNPRY